MVQTELTSFFQPTGGRTDNFHSVAFNDGWKIMAVFVKIKINFLGLYSLIKFKHSYTFMNSYAIN